MHGGGIVYGRGGGEGGTAVKEIERKRGYAAPALLRDRSSLTRCFMERRSVIS